MHKEPSLRGRKKAAKALRKQLFRLVYRFLDENDVVMATDEECINGWWKPVRSKYVGLAFEPKHKGRFRRRSAGFIPIEHLQKAE